MSHRYTEMKPQGCSFRNAIIALLAICPVAWSQPVNPVGSHWALDEVIITNGAKFHGLILEERATGLVFRVINRPPGRPTLTFTTFFAKAEIAKVNKLKEDDRNSLKEKLASLDPNGSGERRRMDAMEFNAITWMGRKDGAKMYEGDQFMLISAAPDEITRRAAVRLDQIYTAFGRYFPAKVESIRPTRIELTGDLDEYKQLLKDVGNIQNPAIFDPAANRIACGTDMRRLGDDLSRVRFQHLQQLAAAERYEKELRQLYKNNRPELDRHLATLKKERDKIYAAERENDKTFDLATKKLFAILYHEAFHSYVMSYVYPSRTADEIRKGKGTGDLPRWLNEGLAQIFETPILEAGELRIGHADADRLKRIQDWVLHKKKVDTPLIPLAELLKSNKTGFTVAHTGQQSSTDKTYLTSYAVAYYLMFDKRTIGTKAMDDYLKALNTGTQPVEAFEAFTGQKIDAFEREFLEFWKRLLPDGNLVVLPKR